MGLLKGFQKEFIELLIDNKILLFGNFLLKSGRTSPYFFNSGLFNNGYLLNKLGEFYAQAIVESKLEFDVIFGPAYKGITLATITTLMLANKFNLNKEFAFNRKEVKSHGEGGNLVGAELKHKRVLIIDDIITAGTAIHESITLLNQSHANIAGVLIAVDRQEKTNEGIPAKVFLKEKYNLSLYSIITLDLIIEFLVEKNTSAEIIERISDYRKVYGV